MKTHIEGNLFLESDGMQFIIKEYTGTKDKDGRELYKGHGYFSSPESAMKKVLKMKVMESTATTLAELVKDIERIKRFVESKLSI